MSGTLVGGIGNIFLGDDGFGVEVVRRLADRPRHDDVHIADFGIRSIDLAYALLDDYDDVILVDAMPRGKPPGTLYVVEPTGEERQSRHGPTSGLAAHGLVPTQAFALAAVLGNDKATKRVRIVGCEPAVIPCDGEVHVGLSAPVAAAIERAVDLVEELLGGQPRHA